MTKRETCLCTIFLFSKLNFANMWVVFIQIQTQELLKIDLLMYVYHCMSTMFLSHLTMKASVQEFFHLITTYSNRKITKQNCQNGYFGYFDFLFSILTLPVYHKSMYICVLTNFKRFSPFWNKTTLSQTLADRIFKQPQLFLDGF